MVDVMPIAEARVSLSRAVRELSANADAEPIVIGSHRKPQAVLMSHRQYVARGASETVPSAVLRADQPRVPTQPKAGATYFANDSTTRRLNSTPS
jgi:PHD/YefM family antitoxin component YafN of YafNO toxin-antitoxin module